MWTSVHTLVHALNDITPMGLAAGLAIIVYQMVGKRGVARRVADNHLSDLPTIKTSLESISRHLEGVPRMERSLLDIRDGMHYLKGKAD
jgi:hypothetical protein